MRVIKALKSLLKNYLFIMPTFIIASLLTYVVSNVAPLVGTMLLMPLTIGIAYAMLKAITQSKKFNEEPLLIGFKRKVYIKNIVYLLIKQFAYLVPIIVGLIVIGYFYRYVNEFEVNYGVLITNIIIFSIPAAFISLMLSFVPYLLADPNFNQLARNPLKTSALMMRGNYIRLIFMRLFFAPWFAWFASGFFVTILSLYQRFIGGEASYQWLSVSWLISLPLNYLLFQPWYLMMHAELYVSLRHKLKDIT